MNLRVPPAVERLADRLHPKLTPFEQVRGRHTLVVKRIEADTWQRGGGGVRERLRRILDGTKPFPVRIDGVDYFADPPDGRGPVVYLSVESEGIRQLHRRLCREFPVVDDLEGENYVPHVTLARGGSVADAERVAETAIDPVEWTAERALTWDREHREAVDRFRLRG
ncbi:2'-5' RNA ligase [Halolamina pelagica]|uniref:2'-5' RNA ligase n=1 Tax=Halolamina pelagica TaxID=699431 RepID=A0A0P7HZI6_9EURY|nr:2'-5' RNA ligase family protein [Halolamina pelagica]KPN29777.1 2'-5' RNA ligase [Halolamina pelagica]